MTADKTKASRDQIQSWLHARVRGAQAQQDYTELVQLAWSHTMTLNLEDCFSESSFKKLMEYYWDSRVLDAFCNAILVPAFTDLVAQLQVEERRLEEFTDDESIQTVEKIVESSGFVRPEWIECFFMQKAVEDVLSESLYNALRDFSTIIPRLVLRNLPSGRFSPLGMAGNLTEKLASQLEKVIEPEIRSFLGAGSQKAMRRACDYTIEQLNSKTSVQMRSNVLRFVLQQSGEFHLGMLSESDLTDLGSALQRTVRGLPDNEAFNSIFEEQLGRFYEAHRSSNFSELLGDLERELSARSDRFAELSWPMVAQIFESDPMRAWMNRFLDEVLDEYDRLGAGD